MLEFPQPFGGVDEVPPLQRWAPVAGLVIALLAVAYGMIPFRQAGVVRCNAPLLGAEPLGDDLEKVGYIRPELACERAAESRLGLVGFVALIGATVGLAAAVASPAGNDCRQGAHSDCRGAWPAMLGPMGEPFACKCACHRGGPVTPLRPASPW